MVTEVSKSRNFDKNKSISENRYNSWEIRKTHVRNYLLWKSRTAAMTRSVLAHAGSWILDGQAGMSKEGNSPDYEYQRRLREHEVRSNRLSWMVMSASADMSVYYESPGQQPWTGVCWHAQGHGYWTGKPVWVSRATARITNTSGDCGSTKCGAIDFHE